MNWDVWVEAEKLLVKYGAMPILAIVPDNQDAHLIVGAFDKRFWDRVKAWVARGWTIAVHGYQHRYVTRQSGIMGVNPYSEFSGLTFETQLSKLQAAMAIFSQNGVRPDTWIAPAHSFDYNTLRALDEVGIRTINDGYSLWPYVDGCGRFWVPQQLWRFRFVPLGVWTVCLHINAWTERDLAGFEAALGRYASRITDMPRLRAEFNARCRSGIDAAFDCAFRGRALIRGRRWRIR